MARLPTQLDIILLAGEPSGDLQGAKLIEELLKLNPNLKIGAVAGPKMRAYPILCIEPMESLQVMGFVDVALALPKIARLFFSLRRKILELSPKAFIGIDYPGFNLRLHRSLKKKQFPGKLIHYICPTVWAWGKKRIPLMASNLDLLLTLLPFEPACFSHTPLQAHYIGHPLTLPISQFTPDPTFRSRYNLSPTDRLISLFPGSRAQEVARNLPIQLNAALSLQAQDPSLKIAISSAHPHTTAPNHLLIPPADTYNLMANTHLALAKSGTVTLELALFKIPTVVTFAIKPWDLFLATKIFKINLPYYALPNLILQKSLFPELFGPNLTPSALLSHATTLCFSPQVREQCRNTCDLLWKTLGNHPASRTAAALIQNLLSSPHD